MAWWHRLSSPPLQHRAVVFSRCGWTLCRRRYHPPASPRPSASPTHPSTSVFRPPPNINMLPRPLAHGSACLCAHSANSSTWAPSWRRVRTLSAKVIPPKAIQCWHQERRRRSWLQRWALPLLAHRILTSVVRRREVGLEVTASHEFLHINPPYTRRDFIVSRSHRTWCLYDLYLPKQTKDEESNLYKECQSMHQSICVTNLFVWPMWTLSCYSVNKI